MKAKKTALLICSLIAAVAVVCTGCGGNKEPVGSSAGSGADAAAPAEKVNAVVMGSNMHHLVSPPATVSLEQFIQHQMASGTAVYSKASDASSVIGSFNEGDQVWAAYIYDNADWYMVAYNGRVAYVPQATVAPLFEDAVEIDYSNYGDYSYYDNSGQEIGNVTQEATEEQSSEEQSSEEQSSEEQSSEEQSSEEQSSEDESSDGSPIEESTDEVVDNAADVLADN